jgi:hypothetical protein
MIEVTTQIGLDRALKKDPNAAVTLTKGTFHLKLEVGAPLLIVLAAANLSIETMGTSAPRIVTRGASAPRIVTRGASAPSIVTRETSAPSIETMGTSAPRIVTRGASAPSIVTRETSAPRIVTWETSAPSIETMGTSAPRIVTRGASAPRIVTRETSAPRIETWETSAPSIETRGASAPRIVTRGTSAPRIETWGASAPSIDARGYSMASICVKSRVAIKGAARDFVSLHIEGPAQINGGHQVMVRRATAEEWCAYYGVETNDGVAILYKGVDPRYRSGHGGDYTPGTTPRLAEFVREPECAAGALYFSPTPHHTHEFIPEPTHYVACPVRLSEIVTHPLGQYPAKVKAIGCCGPVYEVDINGEPVTKGATGGDAQ